MLERFPFSGVVGMSYPMENEPAGFVPLFDTIMKERILERVGPIERALALERDADGADAAAAAKDAAAKRARGKSAVALAFDMERRRMLGVGTPALHPQFSFFLSKHPKNSASCAAPPPPPPPAAPPRPPHVHRYMFLGATDEMLAAEDIKWVDAERKNQYWEVGASSTLHSTTLSIARPTCV